MSWNGGQVSQYCPHCGRPTSKSIQIIRENGEKVFVDNRKKTCCKCGKSGCSQCMHLRQTDGGLIKDQWFHNDCFSSGVDKEAVADVEKAFRDRFVFINSKDKIDPDNLKKVVNVIFCALKALSGEKIYWVTEIHDRKPVKYTVFFESNGVREEKFCWWIRDLIHLIRSQEYSPVEFLSWLIEEYETSQEDDLDPTFCGRVQTGY